jgi:hypothetical protein
MAEARPTDESRRLASFAPPAALADLLKNSRRDVIEGAGREACTHYKFPRRACSRSIASKSALKLPFPKLRLPLRWITS